MVGGAMYNPVPIRVRRTLDVLPWHIYLYVALAAAMIVLALAAVVGGIGWMGGAAVVLLVLLFFWFTDYAVDYQDVFDSRWPNHEHWMAIVKEVWRAR